jgi:hypothetical protein
MPNIKILIVGDGNHQFITNYAIWLNKENPNKFYIDILSFTQIHKENEGCYNTIYKIDGNNLIYKFIAKLKGFSRYYRFFLYKKLLKRLPTYNFIHFHFISVDSYFIVNQFKKISNSKIILTIWGSDLYKLKPVNEKGFLKSCLNADYITFTNQKTIDFFISKHNWENNNLKLCRFGLAPLENLKDLSLSKIEYKNKLGWNVEKLAITIGYNLSSAQQHMEILCQFSRQEIKEFKDEIQLIIPITYGGTEKYKIELLEELKKLPYEFFVYDSFLDDETVGRIRKASDVMVQLQKTDQFSGSMQEYLYAQNIVITGSWLPYETIKEKGAWFIEINKIDDLAVTIPNVINNFNELEKNTFFSPKAISELSSWEKNIEDWKLIYNQ